MCPPLFTTRHNHYSLTLQTYTKFCILLLWFWSHKFCIHVFNYCSRSLAPAHTTPGIRLLRPFKSTTVGIRRHRMTMEPREFRTAMSRLWRSTKVCLPELLAKLLLVIHCFLLEFFYPLWKRTRIRDLNQEFRAWLGSAGFTLLPIWLSDLRASCFWRWHVILCFLLEFGLAEIGKTGLRVLPETPILGVSPLQRFAIGAKPFLPLTDPSSFGAEGTDTLILTSACMHDFECHLVLAPVN